MMRIEEPVQLLVLPVDRQRVLREIVGSDAEEVYQLRELVGDHHRRRRLHHDSQRHLLERYALGRQLRPDLGRDLLRPLHLPDGGDHREHDVEIAVGGRPVERTQLRAEDVLAGEADPDRAVSERRVLLLIEMEVVDLLVRSDVQCPDNDLLAGHHLDHGTVRLELLLLSRIVLALEVEKL